MENNISHDSENRVYKACSRDLLDSSKKLSDDLVLVELSKEYIDSIPNDMELGKKVRGMLSDLIDFKSNADGNRKV
jgi:hypothetical protein